MYLLEKREVGKKRRRGNLHAVPMNIGRYWLCRNSVYSPALF